SVLLCRECNLHRNRGTVAPLSLKNGISLDTVPPELQNLTFVEETMIARCRAKSWIIHLKEEDRSSRRPPTQRGFKGNIIVFPQRPEKLLDVLPPSIHDIVTPICVIFVGGSSAPTKEWLKNKATPLVARREKVRAALVWLKNNNPLYRHI
ncbi:hypothetical protein SISSUDRAFT_959358, partial [Sistotremastrum suecicum HHB10207 ss-3]